MTSTFVPAIENGDVETPVGRVRIVPGGPVEWLANEARSRNYEVDRLEKELFQTRAVLSDLLQEKLPVVYAVEDDSDGGPAIGIYANLDEAKARAEKLILDASRRPFGAGPIVWVLNETHTLGNRDFWSVPNTKIYITPYTVRLGVPP